MRKAVLAGASGCVACGAHNGLEVDHIVPVCEGGGHVPSNLQVLCRRCHRTKTEAESRRARRRKA